MTANESKMSQSTSSVANVSGSTWSTGGHDGSAHEGRGAGQGHGKRRKKHKGSHGGGSPGRPRKNDDGDVRVLSEDNLSQFGEWLLPRTTPRR